MARALLDKRTERERGGGTKLADRDDDRRIRCPACKWTPGRHDRWQCTCLHVWNTFDTHGVCPACSYAWRETQCLRCHAMSPHEAWYVDRDPA